MLFFFSWGQILHDVVDQIWSKLLTSVKLSIDPVDMLRVREKSGENKQNV